jgi:hypothetical protein
MMWIVLSTTCQIEVEPFSSCFLGCMLGTNYESELVQYISTGLNIKYKYDRQ